MKVIIEDSSTEFHVIDLSDYDEVIIEKKTKQYAQGGFFHEMQLRKLGEKKFTNHQISDKLALKYRECMRHGISSEDYDAFLRVEKLRKGK